MSPSGRSSASATFWWFISTAMLRSLAFDLVMGIVLYGLALRYGMPNVVLLPVTFAAGIFLTAPGHSTRLRVFRYLLELLFFFLLASGSYSLVVGPLPLASRSLITLHGGIGQLMALLLIIYLFRHVRRVWTVRRGGVMVTGHLSLLAVRLAVWPATIVGTLVVGPRWFHQLHVWILPAALVLTATHLSHRFNEDRSRPIRRWAREAIGPAVLGTALVLAVAVQKRPPLLGDTGTAAAVSHVEVQRELAPGLMALPTVSVDLAPILAAVPMQCGSSPCHPNVTDEWEASPHRQSANVFYLRVIREVAKTDGVASVRFCASCHDPGGLLTGAYHSQRPAALEDGYQSDGVRCVFCHSIKPKYDPIGNGAYTLVPPPHFLSGPLNPMTLHVSRDLHRADFRAADYNDGRVCAACHSLTLATNQQRPVPFVELAALEDWSQSTYAGAEGVVVGCPKCHMPRDASPDRPGRAEASHRFAASATHLAALAGDQTQLSRVTDFLSKGLTIDVKDVVRDADGRHLKGSIRIANTGVGHRFPAGPADLNEAWLEWRASDAQDREFARSPGAGLDGRLAEGTHAWHKTLFDAEGTAILNHNILRVARDSGDRSIPARGVEVVTFELALPQPTASVRFNVAVKHRKANPDFADFVLGAAHVPLPVTVVAEHEETWLLAALGIR